MGKWSNSTDITYWLDMLGWSSMPWCQGDFLPFYHGEKHGEKNPLRASDESMAYQVGAPGMEHIHRAVECCRALGSAHQLRTINGAAVLFVGLFEECKIM